MIVHCVVVQTWSSSSLSGGEHVPGLRDNEGLLDGKCSVFAFPMLMLLSPDARNPFAEPLLQDVDMLLPDVYMSWRFSSSFGITSDHDFRDGRLNVQILTL